MPQYFDNVEGLEHREIPLDFDLLGEHYHLESDNGVFSKHALDFGTRLLLEILLDSSQNLGTNLLDLGCGAGPIGLILAHLDRKLHVTLSDVNDRALALVEKNALTLGVSSQIEIVSSDVYRNLNSTYDAIVSNPPIRAGKRVTYRIYDEAPSHLTENGSLTIVIRKEQGALSVLAHLKTIFPSVEVLAHKKGYYVIQAKRKGALHAN